MAADQRYQAGRRRHSGAPRGWLTIMTQIDDERERGELSELEQGVALRRSMFGDAAAQATSAPGYRQPFEDLVTRYCFGNVWQRPGLDHKTRSLLAVGMLAMLSRPVQLKAHIRGAVANGATADEIREVLIQVMLYGGLPAAADSFGHATEVMAELGLA